MSKSIPPVATSSTASSIKATDADMASQEKTLLDFEAVKNELASTKAALQSKLAAEQDLKDAYAEIARLKSAVKPGTADLPTVKSEAEKGAVIFVCSQPNSSYITKSVQQVTFAAHSRQVGTNSDSTAREVTVGVFKTSTPALIAELRALVKRSQAFYEVASLNDITGLNIRKAQVPTAISG